MSANERLAPMANSEHLARLKEGVEAWNAWRERHSDSVPEFAGADLSGVDISGANLNGANLQGAQLSGTLLSGARLYRANLSRANLTGANLSMANLSMADIISANLSMANIVAANLEAVNLSGADLAATNLSRASLIKANLSWANFNGANLEKADLAEALVGWTIFADNDFGATKGLDTIHHGGPSTIGIDTIYRSHGKIPLAFLRGAGVPENFIEYMGSLTGKALEFYSCFISYSTKDQEFADRLYADLQNKGVRCWFAPHDLLPGEKLHEQIDDAIRMHERLLLILSTSSMNSEWVKTEIRKARKREGTERKRVLFPVRLVSFETIRDWELFDADEGKDLAVEIREYYMPPDFSDWKNHDSYAQGFQNLLRGLKTKGSKAA